VTATLPVAAPAHVCPHVPPCPSADAVDHDAAKIVASHPEQGWYLHCGGVITFDDGGELVPDNSPCGCHAEPEHRGPAPHNPKES
jgi:hypothetical protein